MRAVEETFQCTSPRKIKNESKRKQNLFELAIKVRSIYLQGFMAFNAIVSVVVKDLYSLAPAAKVL